MDKKVLKRKMWCHCKTHPIIQIKKEPNGSFFYACSN
jgi:hypothetical protein